MGALTVEFHGAFAWVFNHAQSADVALPKARHGSIFQHAMELRVVETALNKSETTAKYVTKGTKAVFALSGRVVMKLDGSMLPAGPLVRRESATLPSSADDFYHVYKLSRLNTASTQPLLPDGWRDRTVAVMSVSSGALSVSGAARLYWRFQDAAGGTPDSDRLLASIVSYSPGAQPATACQIEWNGVTAVVDASNSVTIEMWAECACGAVKPKIGDPSPGFNEVFELYKGALAAGDQLVPYLKEAPPNDAGGPVTPGPDCPQTEHNE